MKDLDFINDRNCTTCGKSLRGINSNQLISSPNGDCWHRECYFKMKDKTNEPTKAEAKE